MLGVIYVMHGYLGLVVIGPADLAGYTIRMGFPPVLAPLLAWYHIAAHVGGGALLILGLWTRWAALAQVPIMAAAVFLFAAVPCAIGTMCGVAILRGLNWGRLLYLCFIPLVLWLSAQMGAVFQIPSVVLYVISLFVLLREGSSFRKNSG